MIVANYDYKLLSFLLSGTVYVSYYIIMNDVTNQNENFLVLQPQGVDTVLKINLFGWINNQRYTLNEFIFFALNNGFTISIADKNSNVLQVYANPT